MFEMDDIDDGFTVNLSEVVKSSDCLAVTRLLAADLIVKPYLSVGDWIGNVSDSDLKNLVQGAELDKNDEVILEDLMLIFMMLRQAEGLPPVKEDEDFRRGIGQLVTMLVGESLARKGLIKLYRENLSFGDDMGDKIVMEKI